MKSLFLNEKYYVWTYAIISIILIFLYFLYCEDLVIPKEDSLRELGSLLGTIVSIFISFQGIALTLIIQSDKNTSIKMLKANNLFGVFIGYFKSAIIIGALCLGLSIILTLGIKLTTNPYFLLLYTFILSLNITFNYRIYKFFFKIIIDHA